MTETDACRHTSKQFGMWRLGQNEDLHAIVTSNQRTQFKLKCRGCGATTGALPHVLVAQWGFGASDIVRVRQNEPYAHEPCSYLRCDAATTEYHHFAPYNTFGNDANNWPVMPLCREHHQEWHRRMSGYQWHRKGVA